MRIVGFVPALATGVLLAAHLVSGVASARVARIDIASQETSSGYVTVRGRAYGELNPRATDNRIIQDIQLAPRNARGLVEYASEFVLSFPQHAQSGSVLLFDAANRGAPIADLALGTWRADGSAQSFFEEQGLIVLRSGWQADAPREPAKFGALAVPRLALDAPTAKQRSGAAIQGPVRAEIIVAQRGLNTSAISGLFAAGHRSYAPVSLDDPAATLTWRRNEGDQRQSIPRSDWRFADCTTVPFPGTPDDDKLCIKHGFDPDYIYEVVYTAEDPLVLGIGFAATRDLVAFFRHARHDDVGTINPITGRVAHTLGLGISQSGNFLKTFVHLGFNRDASGRRVFDGVMPVVASRTTALNVRFGQPGRGAGQHEDHLYPGHNAPSTWSNSYDAIADRRGGLLQRCTRSNTCPRIMQVLSASEYWQLQASPTHVDAQGARDLVLPDNVRLYFIAGTQHTPADKPTTGICVYQNNPAPMRETQRALLVALIQWVRDGSAPPGSVYPRLQARQLTLPKNLAWPAIPGVNYRAFVNPMVLLDYGPKFITADESGVISYEPPRLSGKVYTLLVPQVDDDGNDLGGIRSTLLSTPLGTYTGWNYRAAGFAQDELCGLNGSYFPFVRSRAERMANGDPRLSLEERYGDHAGYVEAVRAATEHLVAQRLLLSADAKKLVDEARASGVLR